MTTCAVLLVEDEAVFAKNIQIYLAREGYEVRIAPDAIAAMAEYDAFRPSIVLLDYNLPGANGLEVLVKMKAKDLKRDVEQKQTNQVDKATPPKQ